MIRAATPERTILSSDCGVYVLPPPVEGLREFLLMIESAGFDRAAIGLMAQRNPASLFKVRGAGYQCSPSTLATMPDDEM